MSCPTRRRRKNNLLKSAIENVDTEVIQVDFQPQRIVFRDDYDIVTLHNSVLSKIRSNFCSDSSLANELTFYENMNSTCPRIQYRIQKLKYKLQGLEVSNSSDFQTESEAYIRDYLKCRDDARRGIEVGEKRIQVIIDYLELAKKYVDLDYRYIPKQRHIPWNICDNCEEDISDCMVSNTNTIVCLVCNSTKKIEFESENINSMNYEPKTNDASSTIVGALHDFQGKNVPKCDWRQIVQQLDDYMQSIGYPAAEKIRNRPNLRNGKKQDTSVPMIIGAMTEIKYKNYNHIWFLCRELWGWELQNLGSLEEEILIDDQELERGYNEIPYSTRQRKSFIPTQVRLCFHLKRKGVTCELEDFKLPTDISRYNELLELSCKNAPRVNYVSL